MDIRREVEAVDREVTMRTFDGEELVVATIARSYPTDVDDLWSACTDPERIPRWFAPVTGELHVGGHYQVEGNAGGTITACDPPRGLDATWELAGQVSWIELRLTPYGAGARFTLSHIAPIDPDFWATYGPGAVGLGWDLGLLGLAAHLTSGAGVTPADFERWAASDPGVEFMTAAGLAWGTASEAIGIAPDDARGRAERTIAFFTGAQDAHDG